MRIRSDRRVTLARALALLVAAAACACGDVEAGARIAAERTLFSLVAREDLREVLREDSRHPVQALPITPVPNAHFDAGTLPGLEMRPPCEVAFTLPATERGAELRFAVGAEANAFEGEAGTVGFEVELEGEPLYEQQVAVGGNVARADKAWRRASLPIAGGGRIVLRTTAADLGQRAEPPLAGFALLELVVPTEVRRERSAPERPNVVLILVDTLRADRLHFGGNPRETSPALDALAARGTWFENARSPSPWTWPSTASLFTALTPPEHGFQGPRSCYLADELDTLAEGFQRAGVTTAAFSCNNLVTSVKNFDQGFEHFRAYSWVPASSMTAEVEAWLGAAREWRFFLYLHFVDPHGPYAPEPSDAALFAGARPKPYVTEHALAQEIDAMQRGARFDEQLVKDNIEHSLGLYDGEIRTVDRQIGRVLARLEELGLDDRTVVAVTSDHGEEFLEHKMLAHGSQLFDESLHVPLAIAGPGVPEGRRERARVENRFLAPTLLALAGVEARANLRGPSLLAADREERPVFFSTELGKWVNREGVGELDVGPLYSVELADLRLIWAPRSGAPEHELVALYDLRADPKMLCDVSAGKPEEVARLRKLIQDWRERADEVRPGILPGDSGTFELLRELGYIGDD